MMGHSKCLGGGREFGLPPFFILLQQSITLPGYVLQNRFNMTKNFFTKLVSVRIPHKLLEGLERKRWRRLKKRSLSYLIVEAIDEYLKNHPD